MNIIIILVTAVVVAFVAGYIVAAMLLTRANKLDVLRWLQAIELTARENATGAHDPLAMVELPGYQAAVRRFRLHFDV